MLDRLRQLLKARTGLIYLVSYEEERIEDSFIGICQQLQLGLYVWDIDLGFSQLVPDKFNSSPPADNAEEPEDALYEIQKFNSDAVFILKDFNRFINTEHGSRESVRNVRRLRNLVRELRREPTSKSIVILASAANIPQELEHDSTLVEYELPDYQTLDRAFLNFVALNQLEKRVELSPESHEKLIKSMQGLTTVQAERALAKIFVRHGKLQNHLIDEALSEKQQIISKTGILEYIDVRESMDDIGGLATLKSWLSEREVAFTESARRYGLPTPKGILMIGVQGVGKSLTAKAVSARWNLPLIRLDVGRVFGSLVGESEERIRSAIRIAEAISPCILWIDELDKAFAGVRGEGGDSGTSARVFGSILTWMQEKTKPVFVVATANNVVRFENTGKGAVATPILPPELLRKGRFDELFFLDLPTEAERVEIFEIMARRYGLRDGFDFRVLANKSGGHVDPKNDRGFGGAEIEQIVIESMYKAFYDNERPVSQQDIMETMMAMKPLYELMKEDINNLREWARGRARDASGIRH